MLLNRKRLLMLHLPIIQELIYISLRWILEKVCKLNNVYFMNLQEAANVFENFTTKYRNMTLGEEQHRVDKLRSETIFKVAVAFEKVVLSYGKYHLSGTRSSKRIVRDNICEHFHGCRFRFVTIDRLFSSCLTNWESNWITNFSTYWLTGWQWLTVSLKLWEIEWVTDLMTEKKKTEWILFVNFTNLTVTYYIKIILSFLSKVLGIQKGYRQNASNFYLEKHEWQASINISSGNFADNGLYTLLLSFYVQYPLTLWLISVSLNCHPSCFDELVSV